MYNDIIAYLFLFQGDSHKNVKKILSTVKPLKLGKLTVFFIILTYNLWAMNIVERQFTDTYDLIKPQSACVCKDKEMFR